VETGSDEACVRVLVTSRVWEEDTKPRMPAIGWLVPFWWAVACGATLVSEVRVVEGGIRVMGASSEYRG
jgi:hypothetical protein